MNVIVANKQKNIIDNANIDAIKDFNGLFNVDDLISKFRNYFFSKLILDATSIVNFTDKSVLEKLSTAIGAERLVILLPEKPLPTKKFVDILLGLKIYNFSNKIEDVVSYIDKPNTYDDIIKKVQYDDSFYVDKSIKENDEYEEYNVPNNNDVSENNNKEDNSENDTYKENNVNVNNDSNVENSINDQVNQGFYVDDKRLLDKKIIGFRNVTEHAGTTTLSFLLKKAAQNKYGKRVLAIETDMDDMKYFQEEDMVSVDSKNLKNSIASSNAEIVFVDLNIYKGDVDFIDDIIYLVEPSIFKLNKLMINDRYTFRALDNKKVILNKSFLTNGEANSLGKEAGISIYMNISTLNDRVNNDIVIKLLNNLLKN